MYKYDEKEYDVIWTAVDCDNNIIIAESKGHEIPQFVKDNIDFTIEMCRRLTCLNAFEKNRTLPFDIEKMVSLYGLYCYIYDESINGYILAGIPSHPTKEEPLPEQGDWRYINAVPFSSTKTKSFKIIDGDVVVFERQ